MFAPESRDAPTLIAGPAESAGLTADAVWVLGASEETWPAGGTSHPFLPIHVQRESEMPHATPQLDWELARAITARLVASANEVRFSYARQSEDAEARSSRLVTEIAGPAHPLPAEYAEPAHLPSLTVSFEDTVEVPLARTEIRGGAAVLTTQSQCAFKAFATARLGAQGWNQAEAGLTASARGRLLHAVMHLIWSGAPDGIRSHDELLALADRRSFVAERVHRVLREEIPASVRERMPMRYLELEVTRLIYLATEWLDYEATRLPFAVSETEADRPINLPGLSFQVRLDRIDLLNDSSRLVVDYKSGNVSPNSWDMPRPDDVQLPLYAAFALDPIEEPLGGLVFAKLRAGEEKRQFAGRVFLPATTLFAGLKGSNALLKNALTLEQLFAWRGYIEQLARDFVAGRADVDPRDYPKTCESCDLHALCRVREAGALAGEDDDGDGEEGGDE